ncbi:MAG: histone deacetylase [Deltaproteobacteria bacterium]|nr:histone deacetylase [Deltaproteobacteria bacterium]
MVGIVKDEIFLEHKPEGYHPENPERLRSIYSVLPDLDKEGLIYIESREATHEELSYIHERAYVEFIASTKGSRRRLDPDTYVSPLSYDAAIRAAGAVIVLSDAIMKGYVKNGFALVRPPGHHAERSRAMGFCLFNNVAIGARYLQNKYGIQRISIIDFDLHHGNGTQNSFYNEKGVLYFSTHQYPYYPGTGWLDEIGENEGKGYTVNVPLSYGMGDEDYVFVFNEILLPILNQYKPDFIMVSAGFDAYYKDPLGGMSLTENGYSLITKILLSLSEKLCEGRLLCVLEGGYNVEGLAICVKKVIEVLKNSSSRDLNKPTNPSKKAIHTVEEVKKRLSPYWTF